MTSFPRSPRVLKGALVSYESQLVPGVPRVVVFQYNPEDLTRNLHARTASGRAAPGGKADAGDILQATGPPQETLSMTIVLDATDQLQHPDQHPVVASTGLHPALATLELLLYPASEQILANKLRAALGAQAVACTDTPLVLLVWGAPRVVPVRIESLSVTERAFDTLLNPIRAEAQIEMTVLTYTDLDDNTVAHGLSITNHVAKEVLAATHEGKQVGQILGSLPS